MSWFSHLLAASISITPLVLLLLWLAPQLQKRYSGRFRTLLWLIIALRLLVPVSLPEKAQLAIPIPAEASKLVQLPTVNLVPNLDSTNYAGASADALPALLAIYLLGAAVLLTRELLIYVGFRRAVLRWAKRPPPKMEERLQELKAELGIRRAVYLQISRNAASPMVVGLLRPMLLLPAQPYPDDELRLIMTHELIHLKYHDIGAKLLLALTAVLHWFNPAVHMMVKAARRDMEMACDDQVVKHSGLDTKKRYCRLLLDLAVRPGSTGNSILTTAIGGSKEILETRIKGILDGSRKRRGIAELTIAALLVLVGGAAVNWSGTEPWNPQPFSMSTRGLADRTAPPVGTVSNEMAEAEPTVGSGPDNLLVPEIEKSPAALPRVNQVPAAGKTEPSPDPSQQPGGNVASGDAAPPASNSGTPSNPGAEVVVIDLMKLSGEARDDNQVDAGAADTTDM